MIAFARLLASIRYRQIPVVPRLRGSLEIVTVPDDRPLEPERVVALRTYTVCRRYAQVVHASRAHTTLESERTEADERKGDGGVDSA
jgi:hypothetical protein